MFFYKIKLYDLLELFENISKHSFLYYICLTIDTQLIVSIIIYFKPIFYYFFIIFIDTILYLPKQYK